MGRRFYRLVHIVGLLAVIRRKRPAYQRSTPEVTAENILNREFTANTVNEKWCTDVTEMKYGSEGEKAYLSAILDLKGRDMSVTERQESKPNVMGLPATPCIFWMNRWNR